MLLETLTASALATAPIPPKAPATLRQISSAPTPKVDKTRAALIIIDAQGEYAHGPLKLDGLSPALAEIVRLRAWAAAAGVPVIHVRHEGRPGRSTFVPGSPAAAFLREATPAAGETVVVKHLPNAFAETNLQDVLKRTGRDQLIITGFMTHMCVDATTRAALDLGYQNFVIAGATADRALAGPDGEPVPSAIVVRSTLAALGDLFAVIVPDAAALVASSATPPAPLKPPRS